MQRHLEALAFPSLDIRTHRHRRRTQDLELLAVGMREPEVLDELDGEGLDLDDAGFRGV